MKITIIILLFSSFALFGQEPIYNINQHNLHLLNYADYFDGSFDISIDNSYEFYKNDKQFNSTNLNLNIEFAHRIKIGINANYNYLENNNNNSNLDAVIKYRYYFNEIYLVLAANIGFINSKIDYSNLKNRYSYQELNPLDLQYNKQNLNLGFGATINYSSKMGAGFYLNHINTPSLPLNNDKIPIKYTAFIRNRFGDFSSILTYSYQDNFYYNPNDLNYYNSMLSYFGANINNLFFYPYMNIGLGYKYLSNNNNVFSLNFGFIIESWSTDIYINYSPSIMQTPASKSIAQFHQVSIYFKAATHRNGGLRFL